MTSRFKLLTAVLFKALTSVPAMAHTYNAQGICTDAGCTEPYEPAATADGWYLLANAGNVEWFSALVNQGGNDTSLWGKMVADIDFTGVTHTPIGATEGTKFNGRFDGQGHRILNLKPKSVIRTKNSKILIDKPSILVLAHSFLASFRLMCGHNARIAPLHKTKTCSKKKCTLTKILMTDLG